MTGSYALRGKRYTLGAERPGHKNPTFRELTQLRGSQFEGLVNRIC
jgi:hypothetical protein